LKDWDGVHSGDSEREIPGGVELIFRGVTTKVYADYLQQLVLDRPVMDETQQEGKFDFDVTFLPEPGMFGGRGQFPQAGGNSAPSLFTALQGQGLRLTSKKAIVQTLVIDHVEMPSAN
jgi:uncharacterized protein (TIGR03435 family)